MVSVEGNRMLLSGSLECPMAHKFLADSSRLWHGGKYRECVAAYRKAVMHSHVLVSWSLRMYTVAGFGSAVSSMQGRYDGFEEDLKLLKKIGDGAFGDLSHTRAKSYVEAGVISFQDTDRQGAARCYQRCLDLEFEGPVFKVLEPAGSVVSCKENFLHSQNAAKENINVLQGGTPNFSKLDSSMRVDTSVPVVNKAGPIVDFVCMCMVLSRLDVCDTCGTACGRNEKFEACGACKARYYCSRKCQRQAWRQTDYGHKSSCRPQGTFKIGDVAQLRNLKNRKDLNGRIVRIQEIQKSATTTDVILVPNGIDNDKQNTIRAKTLNLVYIPKEHRFKDQLYKPAHNIDNYLNKVLPPLPPDKDKGEEKVSSGGTSAEELADRLAQQQL